MPTVLGIKMATPNEFGDTNFDLAAAMLVGSVNALLSLMGGGTLLQGVALSGFRNIWPRLACSQWP